MVIHITIDGVSWTAFTVKVIHKQLALFEYIQTNTWQVWVACECEIIPSGKFRILMDVSIMSSFNRGDTIIHQRDLT